MKTTKPPKIAQVNDLKMHPVKVTIEDRVEDFGPFKNMETPPTPPSTPTRNTGPIIEKLRNFLPSMINHNPEASNKHLRIPAGLSAAFAADDKDTSTNVSPMMTSTNVTPLMSTLPSSANLISMSKTPETEEPKTKTKEALRVAARVPALLLLLYLFVCSLNFLTTSFRLIAGKAAGSVFQSNDLLSNPVVGLMIGVLFTVLVQSSSTCTSVIVSMVSSGIVNVRTAIPMVMGANIGTSLTSTLVSLTHVSDKAQFEKAFAGATVHDCFNWLTVIVLLAFESTTGYLYNLTYWITTTSSGSNSTSEVSDDDVDDGESSGGGGHKKINVLGTITKPLTKKIVQIDKSVLKCWGVGGCQDERLLKVWCDDDERKCSFLLNIDSMSDLAIGLILLGASLILLSACLILIVKLLRSLLQGAVADFVRNTINSDLPYVPWLTGYVAIIMGAILTFVVQSSSVFTSTLTPLVGVGLISVDRVYPLTLGSNLGTTTTALLASVAAAAEDSNGSGAALQIALCHLFFNLSGIVIFYPIPFMRWPLVLCKILGETTAAYRWFAVFYLVMMFFLIPAIVLALSLAGTGVFFSVTIPVALALAAIVIVNLMQRNLRAKEWLPAFLRNWNFLPLWMRSLDPLDSVLRKISGMCCCCCTGYNEIPGGVIATEEELEAVRIVAN